MKKTYKSIDEMYNEDPRRKSSGEVDFGVWWGSLFSEARYRVTWIEKTGEFYVINLWTGEVQIADKKAPTRESAELVMKGWEEGNKYVQKYFPDITI